MRLLEAALALHAAAVAAQCHTSESHRFRGQSAVRRLRVGLRLGRCVRLLAHSTIRVELRGHARHRLVVVRSAMAARRRPMLIARDDGLLDKETLSVATASSWLLDCHLGAVARGLRRVANLLLGGRRLKAELAVALVSFDEEAIALGLGVSRGAPVAAVRSRLAARLCTDLLHHKLRVLKVVLEGHAGRPLDDLAWIC